jgi:hypothetical protein
MPPMNIVAVTREAELTTSLLLSGFGLSLGSDGVFACGAGEVFGFCADEGDFTGVLEEGPMEGAATGGEVKHCCSKVGRQTDGKTALQHCKFVLAEISQFVNVSRKS